LKNISLILWEVLKMRNLFKMDLRRLFRGKVLYILIGVLTSIVLSTVIMSDATADLTALLGGVPPQTAEMEFIGGSMGAGAIYGLLGLIVMLFICTDYSSGFAKNVFSVHTNKWNYFVSKLLTMMVASGVMFAAFVLETVIVGLIVGRSMAVVSPLGLVAFLFQKWLISGAFAAIYIFINLLTRNKAIGCVAAFLLGTGGLVMGLQLFFGMIGIDGSIITDSTIHGTSGLITADFNFLTTLRVLITGAAWTALYGWLSNKVLKTNDTV
jgi:ABC-type transport system involved in multi-copper enzyme maturation permease subunit